MMEPWKRFTFTPVLGLALCLLVQARAEAGTTCDAGKIGCTSKHTATALRCYAAFIKKGSTAASRVKLDDCLAATSEKFASPTGCLAKLEAKQRRDKPETFCSSVDTGLTLDGDVNRFVIVDVLVPVAPSGPSPSPRSCEAAKVKCVVAKLKGLLTCQKKAVKNGLPIDPACLAKVKTKFDGGANRANGCFARIEAKQNPAKPATLCEVQNQSASLESRVDAFVDRTVDAITR